MYLFKENVKMAATSIPGWHFDPPSIPGRIFLFTTLGFSLICFTAYSSTIVATLTVDLDPIKSFKELIKLGFRVAFHDDHDYLFVDDVSCTLNVSIAIYVAEGYLLLNSEVIFSNIAESGCYWNQEGLKLGILKSRGSHRAGGHGWDCFLSPHFPYFISLGESMQRRWEPGL
jgi:hypothetical protein